MIAPDYPGYFSDPFVLRLDDGSYVAYGGSGEPASGERVFEALVSTDLSDWRAAGPVLERIGTEWGDDYWAPEVIAGDGAYWMYYSVGHGDRGHHLRVARAESPLGPFVDQGVNLTPDEAFAIDPHPFVDTDGTRYLFFAHDVLDSDRPGTHLAVVRLAGWTAVGSDVHPALAPTADWQIYDADREMYGSRWVWHTLEGPSVVRRGGRYWMTYSGGAWTGAGYAVSWAVADSVTGPWSAAPVGSPPLLATGDDHVGPGHNSLTVAPDGRDVIAFHAWDDTRSRRELVLRYIAFEVDGPRVGGLVRAS